MRCAYCQGVIYPEGGFSDEVIWWHFTHGGAACPDNPEQRAAPADPMKD